MRPPSCTTSGTRLRIPSASGAALRNPDAPAASARIGRLHTASDGLEERRPAGFGRRLHERDPDRVEHARAGPVGIRLEGESIAENHAAAFERAGEDLVGLGRRHRILVRFDRRVPIRFREDHVERDDRGARLAQAFDQARR